MRQQYENMSEEEKQKAMQQMRQKFENMSDEEKKQMRQRWQQGGSQ